MEIMNKRLLYAFACSFFVSLFIAQPGFSQEYGPEGSSTINRVRGPKKKKPKKPKDKQTQWDFQLTSEFHAMDNLDFRPLNETSNQDEIETDDRQNFAYSTVSAGVEHDVLEDTTFEFGALHSGMWGNDYLGSVNTFDGVFYLYKLNVEWRMLENENLEVSTRIGRQPFEIGGAEDDFFFNDIVDGATVDVLHENLGLVRVLGDVYAANARPRDVDFADYLGGSQTELNFRGDTNTLRFGGLYRNEDKLIDGFDFRAFGFYADIGAGGTGYDRSYRGTLGNFTDNDYTWMAGTRAGYEISGDKLNLRGYGEYARSGGIDRKDTEVGLYDVETSGNAFGGALIGSYELPDLEVELRTQYFRADGGQYAEENGAQFNHGFVSFKGSQTGGMNMDRYAGWHPSAYIGSMGVRDNPNDTSRRSGTQTIRAGVGTTLLEDYEIRFDVWHFKDTSSTNFDQDRIDSVSQDLPFGYSRADLEAQKRFGDTLGTEFDLAINASVNEALSLYGVGGLFIPGEFYETEIDRTAGTALGATDGDPSKLKNFWAVSGGATLEF